MRLRLAHAREYLAESLWFLPTLGMLGAAMLVQLLSWVDHGYWQPGSGLFEFGGPEGARLMLSTVAGSVLSMSVLVFSVTMLVLQLAASQLSPRVMRMFLRDRRNQVILALFVGTFVYSLLALQRIRSDDTGGVPAVTTWIGFALGLLSVAAFVHYLHHMAQSIRASTVIGNIGAETRAAIERMYPEAFDLDQRAPVGRPQRSPDYEVRWPGDAGVLNRVDGRLLMEVAEQEDAVIALIPQIGDFVGHDAPIMNVWGKLDGGEGRVAGMVSVARERAMDEDAAFGLRQLVDIAERALSPGTNDPTTAVQVLDQLHDILRRLAVRAIPSAEQTDDDGRLRLVLPCPDWNDYVALAVDEIRLYGRGSLQIVRRLRYLLEDVRSVAPAARRPPLDRQRRLLDAGIRLGFELDADRETAAAIGRQGHGPTED